MGARGVTQTLGHLRAQARDWSRRHPPIHVLVRLIKYGPIYGFRNRRFYTALVRQGMLDGWRMLNLGSGGRRHGGMVNVDITPVTGPDVVGDGFRLPFADATFDAVFCEYVIEHVPDPEAFLAAAGRLLKPEGVLYLEIPFLQPLHGEGADFMRWTRQGFTETAKRAGLEVMESGVHVGPAFTLYWLLKEWIAALFSLGLQPLFAVFRYVLGWLLVPLLLFDLVMMRLPLAENLANGFFVVATPTGGGGQPSA